VFNVHTEERKGAGFFQQYFVKFHENGTVSVEYNAPFNDYVMPSRNLVEFLYAVVEEIEKE